MRMLRMQRIYMFMYVRLLHDLIYKNGGLSEDRA